MPFGWGANPNRDGRDLAALDEAEVTNAFRLGG